MVWQWMSLNLAPLRVGTITLKQFCDQFNEHFKVNITFSNFCNIFNSMCILDKTSIERVAKFKEYLEEHDEIQFVLVSHTNYSHLYFILTQLQEFLPKGEDTCIISDEMNWSPDEKILFAPSMSSKCTEHPDTLKYALNKLKIESHDQIISFLNTIKEYDHPNFCYADPGKDLEKVVGTIETILPKKSVVYGV